MKLLLTLFWPLRARRLWRSGWSWICRRSPHLCAWLESGRKVVFCFDPEVLEAQIAALSLVVAIRWMFRVLRDTDLSSLTLLLTSLLPLWAWALLFGFMGLGHIIGLAVNRLQWRASSAMLGVLIWSFVSVLMMLDGLNSPGTVLFPIIALSEAWVYLRLTTCCFESDSPLETESVA